MIQRESKGSEAITRGVRVSVQPRFMPEQSNAEERRYLFAYHVTISNESSVRVRLVSRRWLIVDAEGQRREVQGPGVVGEFPDLAPGERHDYSSYCPLATAWGTMEGTYLMRDDSGDEFEAGIARFYLVATALPASTLA